MSTASNSPHGLTDKQKAYADTKLKNPHLSNTKVALEVYNTTSQRTASVIATENERKPAIRNYLTKHSENIEEKLTDTFYRYIDSKELDEVKHGTTVGMWIHDKVNGKATTVTESKNININIDAMIDDLD